MSIKDRQTVSAVFISASLCLTVCRDETVDPKAFLLQTYSRVSSKHHSALARAPTPMPGKNAMAHC
jgi:hypothetical protein